MAEIVGTNVGACIYPTDTADTYPSHDANFGKGGLHSVADNTARDAIEADRRYEGMMAYAIDSGKTYQLQGGTDNGDWVEIDTSATLDGSGTAGYIPKWSDSDTLSDSIMRSGETGIIVGSGETGYGYSLTFDGNTYDGEILWDYVNGYFDFNQSMRITKETYAANFRVRSGERNATLYLDADYDDVGSGSYQDPRLVFQSGSNTRTVVYYDESESDFIVGSSDSSRDFAFDFANSQLVIGKEAAGVDYSLKFYSANDAEAQILFWDDGGTPSGSIIYDHSDDSMTLTASGDVVINTTAQINSNSETYPLIVGDGSETDVGIKLDGSDSDGFLGFESDNSRFWFSTTQETTLVVTSPNNNATILLDADTQSTASGDDRDPRMCFKSGSATQACLYFDDSSSDFIVGSSDSSRDFTFDFANSQLVIGKGAAGVDYSLKFDGQDSDGIITWMEDEARFEFDNSVHVSGDFRANMTNGQIRCVDTGSISGSAGTYDLDANLGGNLGFIFIVSNYNESISNMAEFWISGDGNSVSLRDGDTGNWAASDSANRWCIISTGSGNYQLKNNLNDASFTIFFIGDND